uniref:Uncharacterized protein n=1 Tax=Bionectria ochroleuca TaxID=29856 RepID=A0A0B7KGL7_BIOOC
MHRTLPVLERCNHDPFHAAKRGRSFFYRLLGWHPLSSQPSTSEGSRTQLSLAWRLASAGSILRIRGASRWCTLGFRPTNHIFN